MPINIRIDGDPESIRSAGHWLRSSLAPGVEQCVTQVHRARTDSEAAWEGLVGDSFRTKVDGDRRKADSLAVDTDLVGRSFERYADELRAAQEGMDRARRIASDAGLEVTTTQIFGPGEGPTALTGGGGLQVTPQLTTAYNNAVDEANRAWGIVERAKDHARNIWRGVVGKRYFVASDFIVNSANAYVGQRVEYLRNLGDDILERGGNYYKTLASKATTPQTRAILLNHERKAVIKGFNVKGLAKIKDIRRAGRIPAIGAVVTVAGIGYDISRGKSPGKSILTGVGGAYAGAKLGVMVGGAVGGPPGAVLGVVVGGLGGVFVSYGLGWVWEQLPDDWTNAIDNGLISAGNYVVETGSYVVDKGGDLIDDGGRILNGVVEGARNEGENFVEGATRTWNAAF